MDTTAKAATADFAYRSSDGNEAEAIRGFQQRIGMAPCFRTGYLLICTTECQWRASCRTPVAEWRRDW